VNQLFGDIVKVTPSSKVVGDMALFLFSRGIKAADVVNLEPGSIPFPESVIDMMAGGLGWPEGGWPEKVSLVVLGEKRHKEARAKYLADIAAKKNSASAHRARRSPSCAPNSPRSSSTRAPTTTSTRTSCIRSVFADFAKHSASTPTSASCRRPRSSTASNPARKSPSTSRKARRSSSASSFP
jgi:pyruvate carboxylase